VPRHLGEQVARLRRPVTDKARHGGEADQGLDDVTMRARHQKLRAQTDLGSESGQLRAHLQLVVDRDLQWGREGVQVGVHEACMVDRWRGNADHGRSSRARGGSRLSLDPVESLVSTTASTNRAVAAITPSYVDKVDSVRATRT
jgi:hypothetical protein